MSDRELTETEEDLGAAMHYFCKMYKRITKLSPIWRYNVDTGVRLRLTEFWVRKNKHKELLFRLAEKCMFKFPDASLLVIQAVMDAVDIEKTSSTYVAFMAGYFERMLEEGPEVEFEAEFEIDNVDGDEVFNWILKGVEEDDPEEW